MLVEQDRTISLDASEKVNYSRPSIDVTFESAAEVYGSRMVGIILSGGNTDGAAGLFRILEAGGLCVVQDPLSASVPFMPEYALSRLKQPYKMLNIEELATFVSQL